MDIKINRDQLQSTLQLRRSLNIWHRVKLIIFRLIAEFRGSTITKAWITWRRFKKNEEWLKEKIHSASGRRPFLFIPTLPKHNIKKLMFAKCLLWPGPGVSVWRGPPHLYLKTIDRSSHRGSAEQIWLVSMRTQVQLLSGLKVQRCCELWCRSQTRLGPGIAVAVV